MVAFLLRRLLESVFVLVGITLFVSFTIRLSGDPAVAMFSGSNAPTQEQLRTIRERLGTDRPFVEQYLTFVAGVARGDLGTSFRTGGPVAAAVAERFPATVGLAFAALAISLVIAVPLGVAAARRRGSGLDLGVRVVTLLGLSFPNFWLGIMFILIFGVRLRWLPPSGLEGPISYVLPSRTLGLILASTTTRLVRSSLLDVLGEQYVVTARAKGCPRGPRRLPPRAPDGPHPGRDLRRPPDRRPDRRRGDHRTGLRVAGPRHARAQRHLVPRLPHAPRHHHRSWPRSSPASTCSST